MTFHQGDDDSVLELDVQTVTVRPIRKREIRRYCSITDPDGDVAYDFSDYLRELWDAGNSRPSWCFVAEAGATFIARVVFWGMPNATVPVLIDLLDIADDHDFVSVGEVLLRRSLTALGRLGGEAIEYHLESNRHVGPIPSHERALMRLLGFRRVRTARRFERTSRPVRSAGSTGDLRFRSLDDVGHESFVGAIAAVSRGCLDRRIRDEVQRLGPDAAARRKLANSLALHAQPEWWQLAYTPAGELVGLVMPSLIDGRSFIDYIGVVPERRGHRHIDRLIARAIEAFDELDAPRIRADTDAANLPMLAALRRAGFRQFSSRAEYRLVLPSRSK